MSKKGLCLETICFAVNFECQGLCLETICFTVDLKHHVIIIYKIPILFDLPSTRGLSEHAAARRFREDPFLRGCCFELLLMLMMLLKPLMLLKMMLMMKMMMIVLILDKVMLSSMMFQSEMS